MAGDNDTPTARKVHDDFEENMREVVKHFVDTEGEHERWDIDQVESKLRLESASRGPPARATFRLYITPKMANFHNSIHGGCTATVIDILSSMLVIGASQPGMFQVGGVSRNLNVTYLRPMRVGSEVRVICELVQMGKRLALVKTEIRSVDNDELCALGDHQKANTDSKPFGKI
ncbi:hypothetical protein UA08_07550 [Talaromyces atroroseus]|uniref:Thioesterase domain-containing protein n=1 Tax=Talaromyces atroroseus TaxID=1441469 RepID=A0A225AG69_TALAT|nr:hypothetical protein UA08_07550 [Talaromyces atroroseus]OKL57104.1 hypothetical protein UA08_07550 [Talaromyces atroroseus]